MTRRRISQLHDQLAERDRQILANLEQFRLLDTRNFPKETVAGRWVEAKGFLIRTPGDDKLNLTWLRMVGEMCRNGK